jgi:Cu/Ag efflux protein CusF
MNRHDAAPGHEMAARRKRSGRGAAAPLLALALAALCLTTACGGDADTGRGRGVVTAVTASEGKLTIDHGDVPGVMKAMTMEFQADPALLAGIEAGSQVEFRVVYENGAYRLTELRPAAP